MELIEREREVLSLIVRGLNDNEIASELSIMPKEAENNTALILKKLNAKTRIQAAIIAIKRNLVD